MRARPAGAVVSKAVSGSLRAAGAPQCRYLRAPWLEPSTTPDGSVLDRRFRITHPFHPWSGQEFELVTYLHTWGEHRVYFYKEGEHLVSVPASWTNILAVDPVVQVAAGRAMFRAVDLIELEQFIQHLRGLAVKGILS